MNNNLTSLGYQALTPDYGYYLAKLPQNLFDELKNSINKIKSSNDNEKKYLYTLQIQHAYKILINNQFKDYIKQIAGEYEKCSNVPLTNFNEREFDDTWVNFLGKNEYNPLHKHRGIYSFVVWCKIPYTLEEESKYAKNDNSTIGDFVFYYPTMRNGSMVIGRKSIGVDSGAEGYMILFPASLNHAVYPHYSTSEYRISMAGNIT